MAKNAAALHRIGELEFERAHAPLQVRSQAGSAFRRNSPTLGRFPLLLPTQATMSWVYRDPEPVLDASKCVELQPDSEQHWVLCRRVVSETREYLQRERLLNAYEEPAHGAGFLAHATLQLLRNHLWECLVNRCDELAEYYASSKQSVTVKAAWGDWQARQVAFQSMYNELAPLYLTALDELLSDLSCSHAFSDILGGNPCKSPLYSTGITLDLTLNLTAVTNPICNVHEDGEYPSRHLCE